MSTRNCHKGPNLVIDKDDLEIYGASKQEALSTYLNFDLVISLDYTRFHPAITKDTKVVSKGLVELRDKYSPEILSLDWPDMSIPVFQKEFWLELVRVLKKKGRDRNRFNRKYKVMVHCIGGHGRTGTCLCILGNLIDRENWKGDLVKIVREKHCENSVESKSQIKYIEEITGEKQDLSKGSKSFGNSEVGFIYKSPKSITSSLYKGDSGKEYGNPNKCTYCFTIYNNVKEAYDCEDKHRERIKKNREEKKKQINEKIEKFVKGEILTDEEIGEKRENGEIEDSKKNIDDYFAQRKNWRKDYTN